jgi:hypothetical protein
VASQKVDDHIKEEPGMFPDSMGAMSENKNTKYGSKRDRGVD